MCKYFRVFVLCVIYMYLVKVQAQEGSPCETPDQESGFCVTIYSCKVVTDMLSSAEISKEVRNFVKGLACGYKGSTPLVCCVQQSNVRNTFKPAAVDENVLGSEELNNNPGNFLTPPKCGVSNTSLPKVVGGVPAKLGEFPWIVALGYKNPKNENQPKWLCGGSLISMTHVITAGHCVHNRPDLYLARVGELDLYDDFDGAHPVDIPIASAKIHESYSPRTFTNDLAILTLTRTVEGLEGVLPICLPWENDKRNKTFLHNQPFVAGWGALYFNGPSSSSLQLTTLPVVDNSNCVRAFGNRSVIDERIICAGYLQGGKDACQGDSGGPLMFGGVSPTEKTLRFYLIGVVSYGFRCAEAGYPGVYTRITHFLQWIQTNIV